MFGGLFEVLDGWLMDGYPVVGALDVLTNMNRLLNVLKSCFINTLRHCVRLMAPCPGLGWDLEEVNILSWKVSTDRISVRDR